MKVLFVEDSPSLQRSVGAALRKSGYAVDSATDGGDGLWRAETGEYDVVILDFMLPGIDGLTVLQRMRNRGNGRDTPVLLLTAKDSVADRVCGLRAGADDYLIKPFSIDELLARVEALIRRRHGNRAPLVTFGDLEVDTAARTVRRGGVEIELTPREFTLLHLLVLHAGEVVTRTQIETSIYDDRADLMSNVVDAAVYALRRKIDRHDEPSLIQTRRGMGYVFHPPAESPLKAHEEEVKRAPARKATTR